jgi:protein gp37
LIKAALGVATTVQIAREKLQRADDARALVRQVFTSAVDLSPDSNYQTLTVRPLRLSSAAHGQVLEHLRAELTGTETTFPGTDLRLVFEAIRSQ